jgi:MgsA AAA+ ATPase C terminal
MPPTKGGYDSYEVMSAFQKSVRRGDEYYALYWGTEMALDPFNRSAISRVWNQMQTIASEDVGLANPNMCLQIRLLREMYEELPESRSDTGQTRVGVGRLYITHAILLLVHSKKSRACDYATIAFFNGSRLHETLEVFETDEKARGAMSDVPDFALDKHTRRGRRKRRGVAHFFEVGGLLANESPEIVALWKDKARQILLDIEQAEKDAKKRSRAEAKGRPFVSFAKGGE